MIVKTVKSKSNGTGSLARQFFKNKLNFKERTAPYLKGVVDTSFFIREHAIPVSMHFTVLVSVPVPIPNTVGKEQCLKNISGTGTCY